MAAGLKVSGFDQASQLLAALGRDLVERTQKSTERTAHRVRERYADLVERDTGALAESPEVHPIVGASVRGHEVIIDREKLVAERRSRGGRIGFDKQRNEDVFHAALVEFDEDGNRPMRTALAMETRQAVDDIANEVRAAVREASR